MCPEHKMENSADFGVSSLLFSEFGSFGITNQMCSKSIP